MDNLTHSLTGLLLARSGLNRLAPRATALAVIAANLPDLDIVTGVNGSLCYLANHRGFTHALSWAPLAAAATLPFWWLLARKQQPARRHWAGAYLVSLIAILSHLGLDFLNVYGIRLHLPFSAAWLRLDLVHIVDVWLWSLLLVCTLGPMLARLVYSEIGARGGSGRGMAITALLLMGAYFAGRAELHARAIETLQSRLYASQAPSLTVALPSAASPWQWTGLVETQTAWHAVPVNLLLRDFDPDAGRIFYKPDTARVRAAVLSTKTARAFLNFSQCPLWRVTPVTNPDGASLVRIYDLRFGLPEDGAFSTEYLVDASGKVLRERFSFGNMKSE
jgi:inner membrane protein